MAIRYVSNLGSNLSPYDSWATAATTMVAGFTGSVAGDIFYIAHDHTEQTVGAITLTAPGSAANPAQIITVNRLGSVPPVAADLRTMDGSVTTNSIRSQAGITLAGSGSYWYGVCFIAGVGSGTSVNFTVGNTAQSTTILQNCIIRLVTTNAGARISFGNNGVRHVWDNTWIEFNNVGAGILPSGNFTWRNTAVPIGPPPYPTTLFIGNAANVTLLENLDFTVLSGKTLVGTTLQSGQVIVKNCKVPASFTFAATPSVPGTVWTDVINCDSGATNTRNERYRYEGTETTETTIVRTGGATDGTTPVSRKIVTTANCKTYLPFEAMPLAVWNETVGSAITLTMEGTWGSGVVPNNNQVWWDVAYTGSSASPLGSTSSGTVVSPLGVGVALASSASAWGGGTTRFKQSHTITPQMKGWIYVYPRVGIASTTVYLDPKITVS